MNGLTPVTGRVVRRQRETADTVTLWIEAPATIRRAIRSAPSGGLPSG